MAQGVREVLRIGVDDLGLTLRVQSSIDRKQAEYECRIREDDPASDCLVDYTANVRWSAAFGEGEVPRTFEAGERCRAKPVFFETRYFFRGDFANAAREIADVQVLHRMSSVEESFNYYGGVLVGTLDFVNEPGRFRFELRVVYKDGGERLIAFEFMVVSVKMNVERDYKAILGTIEKKRPHLAQSFLSKTVWGAGFDGEHEGDDKTWYQILSDVFEYYVRACKRIVNNPHQRFVRVAEYCRADRIRRWTPELTRRYGRLNAEQRCCTLFRTERTEGAVDTAENRFVLHSLKALAERLDGFADEQEGDERVSRAWIGGVRGMAAELRKLSRHPFFRGVGRFAGFRQQSLVMQKRAGYAQILAVWMRLKQALKPGGDDVDIGYRPISMLYEFWCFLKMWDVLEGLVGPAKQEVSTASREDELLDTPELVDGSRVDETKLCKYDLLFEKGGVEYVLSYQKTYNVRDLDGNGQEAFSSLNPQRPDVVLMVKANGNEYSYLFDAKYRVWTFEGKGHGQGDVVDATTRDAIDAMYRYRDAILYRMQKAGIKREIIGAYVLYPGRRSPHLYEPYRKTIRQEGIGAIPLLPGFDDELVANLKAIVGRHAPEEHLATATSVRGTSVVVGKAYGESAFLTLPRGEEGRLWRWRRKGKELEVRQSAISSGRPLDVAYVKFTGPFASTEVREVSFANGGEWIVFTVT